MTARGLRRLLDLALVAMIRARAERLLDQAARRIRRARDLSARADAMEGRADER